MQSSLMPDVDQRGPRIGKKKRVKRPHVLWCWSGWGRKPCWHKWARYADPEQARKVREKQERALPSWKWEVAEVAPPPPK